jgi:transposase-like protein
MWNILSETRKPGKRFHFQRMRLSRFGQTFARKRPARTSQPETKSCALITLRLNYEVSRFTLPA